MEITQVLAISVSGMTWLQVTRRARLFPRNGSVIRVPEPFPGLGLYQTQVYECVSYTGAHPHIREYMGAEVAIDTICSLVHPGQFYMGK